MPQSEGPNAHHTAVVVPCFNEARRLDVREFQRFAREQSRVRLVLVNDGSTDDTLRVLREIQSAVPARVDVVDLPSNRGKAEAVRLGMLAALEGNPRFAGYWDADLATPLDACLAFLDVFEREPQLEIVTGARVLLLGRTIQRRAVRHYAGRVFATMASLALDLPVYDTQCGAKLFRASPRLRAVLDNPFLTKWTFDVEIIARYGMSGDEPYSPAAVRDIIHELPLLKWTDVPGSKVRARDFVRAFIDLSRIRRAYMAAGVRKRRGVAVPRRA